MCIRATIKCGISSLDAPFYHRSPFRRFSGGSKIPTDRGTAGKWGNDRGVSRDFVVTAGMLLRHRENLSRLRSVSQGRGEVKVAYLEVTLHMLIKGSLTLHHCHFKY